ncbi:MAG: hypothetical protein ACLT8E_08035 [Akkermansia sp.]
MKLFEWLEGQCYADHPEVHEALITETRHFGVPLEIPRLQIKGLIAGQASGGRWVYEAFANRWKSDHGSCCAQGAHSRHSRESGPGTAVGGFYHRLTGGTAATGKDSLPRQKGEAHARPQAAEPLTAHARRRKRPHAGVKSGSPCGESNLYFFTKYFEANCTFHV